jgi:hypothetical protein
MRELDAAGRQFGKTGIDIGDLEPQSGPVWVYRGGGYRKEDCEAVAVLKRDCAPFRHLEFDLQA